MRALATSRTANKQRRYRKRYNEGVIVPLVPVDPLVQEALYLQGLDAGMTEKQAIAESKDHTKVAAALAKINLEWARLYIEKRNRYR